MEIKSIYTAKEIIEFIDEKIRHFQRTTSHNVKVLFAMYNFLHPNNKEFTTGCSACTERVKRIMVKYVDDIKNIK